MQMTKKKVLVVFGTRPEAIKMCPLIIELKKRKNVECKVCLTGQHKEMLNQVMETFRIKEDYNLNIMKKKQTITDITIDVLDKLDNVMDEVIPDLVLVHGDTTTSFAAALAAFYKKIPVGHVEAGLRTGNKYSPYPEEMNRCLTSKIASFHFAPTAQNARNLENEGIVQGVYITGNTVIDSFKYTVTDNYMFENDVLKQIDYDSNKIILMTAHRRENLGEPLTNIFNAVKRIAMNNSECIIVYPVHPNPQIGEEAQKTLGSVHNIKLIDPVNVLDMHNLLKRCYMVLTDSGGLQEEAPALGKPVLVLRNETERPEAVTAGTVKLVGTTEENIVRGVQELINSKEKYERMANAVSPYGDGNASRKITDIILDNNNGVENND